MNTKNYNLMKLPLLIALLTSISYLTSKAAEEELSINEQDVRAIGPLPNDKVAETLRKGERNPFAERQTAATTKEEDGESENAKLMRILNEITISGVIHDTDGRYKVLVGRRLLTEGDRMPQLLEGQTSMLRVSKVSEKSVSISWVEDQAGATPRTVIKQVRVNQPLIEQRLPGLVSEPGNGKGGKQQKSTMSVWVTPKGETFREESTDAPASSEEGGNRDGGLPPTIDLNHRPRAPTVQRATRINSR